MIKKWLQLGNLLAVIFCIVLNALANILPINGKTTGTLSDNIPNLFVPAGLTFSIWGVIYFQIFLFGIYQARDLFRKEPIEMKFLDCIGPWFIITSLANGIWILFWHYEQVAASLIIMLILLGSLLLMYLRLRIGISDVPKGEKIFVHGMVSVYLGWITVATIANVTALLVTTHWDRWGIEESIWKVIVLIIVMILTVFLLSIRKDFAFTAVILWAFVGILIKRLDPINSPQPLIVIMVIMGLIVLILMIGIVIRKKLKKLN